MQEIDDPKSHENPEDRSPSPKSSGKRTSSDGDAVLDVSGKNLEFALLEKSNSSIRDLYMYKNEFNLLPRWVGQLRGLKTLKFFANEVNLFPPEFAKLVKLERLQVKISPPGLEGFAIQNMKGLKELELSRPLSRPSVFPLLSEIAQLKCLTKLSVCHFSIRCLPPEIGCLDNLEHLDLSFNKMKSLPEEITHLNSLISLKVAHNKLVELPPGLTSLQQLENLDLSNNRLTSLGSLELGSMCSLRRLNLQFNKILSCRMPSWICCKLEGNVSEVSLDDSSVEMDVYESSDPLHDGILPHIGSCHTSASILSASSSSSRSFSARKTSKRWKRRHYLQQRARQERLNYSRKWKSEKHSEDLTMKTIGIGELQDENFPATSMHADSTLETGTLDDDVDKPLLSGQSAAENILDSGEVDKISLKSDILIENCSPEFDCGSGVEEDNCCKDDSSVSSGSIKLEPLKPKSNTQTKRHCDMTTENPKPCKCLRPTADSNLSRKYSSMSFCSTEDHLPDGFYDAGRDRPFMSLTEYEQILHLESREVISIDRGRDEMLDAITRSAQALVFRFKCMNSLTEDGDEALYTLQVVSLLALFVSDHFGGCDRTSIIERMRRSALGSNYQKPFVCTCSTATRDYTDTSTKKNLHDSEDIVFPDLCEKSLHSIKARRNSVIVPIGTLKFGVCRHRALLLKYLCDRVKPPVPCELVRGYLDFSPHAWNVVLIRSGDSLVRMVVDACCPHDIREETDPEYLCRYIPLSRSKVSVSTEIAIDAGSFPSLSKCDEIAKAGSTSLVRCTFGSNDVVAKVRTLEVGSNSSDSIRNFEYSCLGEVRLLGVLEHSCIVKMVGHQMYSKWINGEDGNPERRILVSAIYMEHIKGGSLKNYVEKLSKSGKKHVPVDLALLIARDVACALDELHSKHIIHRDVKSENVLVDLESKRADGTPVVKLCDFDRATPLRSPLHTCCIAHTGIPPPDVCVGTPRWMAPEVFQAMQKPKSYGLEVDIWSYGCLLLELLTLQVPYSDISDSLIHELLQNGERPKLTDEMEALSSSTDHSSSRTGAEQKRPKEELESLKILVDLFYQCTKRNPVDRPSARDIYKSLLSRTEDLFDKPDLERE